MKLLFRLVTAYVTIMVFYYLPSLPILISVALIPFIFFVWRVIIVRFQWWHFDWQYIKGQANSTYLELYIFHDDAQVNSLFGIYYDAGEAFGIQLFFIDIGYNIDKCSIDITW